MPSSSQQTWTLVKEGMNPTVGDSWTWCCYCFSTQWTCLPSFVMLATQWIPRVEWYMLLSHVGRMEPSKDQCHTSWWSGSRWEVSILHDAGRCRVKFEVCKLVWVVWDYCWNHETWHGHSNTLYNYQNCTTQLLGVTVIILNTLSHWTPTNS